MLRTRIFIVALCLLASTGQAASNDAVKGDRTAKVEINAERVAGSIDILVESWRKIGNITVSVQGADKKIHYLENGKAHTNEFVRRLDRRTLPKGELKIEIRTRDLHISRIIENH